MDVYYNQTTYIAGKERQWLKNQTHGDLDDGRIIEGLTGEKSIYRRRGEKEPEPGSPQTKPKRWVDVLMSRTV